VWKERKKWILDIWNSKVLLWKLDYIRTQVILFVFDFLLPFVIIIIIIINQYYKLIIMNNTKHIILVHRIKLLSTSQTAEFSKYYK